MSDSKLPQKIFLDPRVASRMPNSAEEAGENLAQGSAEPVAYILEEYHTKRVREAANIGREIIIQIQTVGEVLYGITNHGQLYRFHQGTDVSGWDLIAARELSP